MSEQGRLLLAFGTGALFGAMCLVAVLIAWLAGNKQDDTGDNDNG